jgi:hypothetical protein
MLVEEQLTPRLQLVQGLVLNDQFSTVDNLGLLAFHVSKMSYIAFSATQKLIIIEKLHIHKLNLDTINIWDLDNISCVEANRLVSL